MIQQFSFCYSTLVILIFHQSFFMILSAIFEFSSYATMSQSFFATAAHPFFDFVILCQPFCNLSVILGI
jgi:hypothetical protein